MSDTLEVARDRVVRFHYEIRDGDGTLVESTRDSEPLAMLYGRGNVLKGVEDALAGLRAGARVQVTLDPAEAYGERQEGRTQRVSKKYFQQPARLKPGMVTQLHTEQGARPVTVLKVGGKVVDVDLNHPQAGKTLSFDLEVVEVREASSEEIAHRHVHGPGGHAH